MSSETASADIIRVKVIHSSETELCRCSEDIEVNPGDIVIIPTKYGKDLGKVLGPIHVNESEAKGEFRPILRLAVEKDLALFEENLVKEKEALEICKEKVAD